MSGETEPFCFDDSVYRDYRRSLVDLGNDQLKTFDRAILGLSSGAFGLSMVFLKDIAGGGQAQARWFLMAAWGGYLIAIVVNVWSYYLSWEDSQTEIVKLDECYRNQKPMPPGDNKWKLMTLHANKSALTSFVCATVALAIFAFSNL